MCVYFLILKYNFSNVISEFHISSINISTIHTPGTKFQNYVLFSPVTGVLLYLPSSTRAACPLRTYSMSTPDPHWTPLIHRYLRGLQQVKQDGVTFQDFMVNWLLYK